MRLPECRAVLTGASGGIGLALAEKLCAGGAQLIAVTRQEGALSELLQRYPKQVRVVAADLGSASGRQAVVDAARALGGVNLLINAAGVNRFALPGAPWVAEVPAVPPAVPSTLLQRRPDIAAAERAVAAANAQIGIQRAAYFPSLSLGATLGSGGSSVADLFRASGTVWSLGLSIAQTLFDAGATAARVDAAQAARDARVAAYRQTVLTAFQSVEDQLTVLRTLQEQEPLRREAVSAAERTAQQLLNRYREGQVGYTEVVAAQVSALSAQRALLQLQVNRKLAVVALVQALGGGWQAPWQAPA